MRPRYLGAHFYRMLFWRLATVVAPGYAILLEYPIDPVPRWGRDKPPHPELDAVIRRNMDRYAEHLRAFAAYGDNFSAIAGEDGNDPREPTFLNNFFSGLDAISLYGFLCLLDPQRFFEVGSGNSTRFARRAIRDHGLRTTITSCDPQPRAEIDELCDRVIRQPLESLDVSVITDTLEAGDILFIDNSHRCFTNSDVTVFFLEILPRLKPGVVIHVHDILLPDDYPPQWSGRHYSEQYLLACSLLANAGFEIMLPNAFVSRELSLSGLLDDIWKQENMGEAFEYAKTHHLGFGYLGFSFWFRKSGM